MNIDVQAQRTATGTEISITAQYTQASCCEPDCCGGTASAEATPDENVSVSPASATPTGFEADARSDEAIKALVREKYAAVLEKDHAGCGCGPACCDDLSMIGEGYEHVDGYVAEADYGLGCGLPTEHAALAPGQVVLDLGAGAGVDAFVARTIVGEEGEVLGVDFTPEMVQTARANAEKLGFRNVTFYEGDIEALPLPDERVDVVVSNCVLNLVPNKEAAFAEMYRVLRPGGHFCISDIVVRGALPPSVRTSAALYVGCVAGAIPVETYLEQLRVAGFKAVRVAEERVISIPDSVLESLLSEEDRVALKASNAALISITVYGEK